MPNKRGVGIEIKGGGGGIFVKFNKRRDRTSKNPLILVTNEKKRHKLLILMLKLKVSKQMGSAASKNKVSNNQKSIKHINKLSKYK